MKESSSQKELIKKINFSEEEFDLVNLFSLVKKQKKFVFLLSSLLTLGSIIYSGTIKSKWSGGFQIIVKDANTEFPQKGDLSKLSNLLGEGTIESDNLTQLAILKSQSVLLPVFEYAKKEKEIAGESVKKLTYKNWLNSHLEIAFEKGTSVLNISYVDNNKKRIRSTLNLISKKYQDYSLRDRNKNLDQVVSFLKNQIKLQENKSTESFKKFNSHSLEHGLGNLDGFIPEENPLKNLQNFTKSQNANDLLPSGASERYISQFKLLQANETRYVELSSKLKKNSQLMLELEANIKNLKSKLKRPNEILIKFRELKRIAARDEALLSQLEDQLSLTLLEKAKQPNPWQLISSIVIDDIRVSPNRKKITILSLIISVLFSSLLAIFFEKRKGLIFNFKDFDYLFPFEYLGILYGNEKEFNLKKIKSSAQGVNDKKGSKLGIICASSEIFQKEKSFTKFNLFKDEFYSDFLFITPLDYKQIEDCQKLLIIVEDNCINYKDFDKFLNYLDISKQKIIGWLNVVY